MRSGVALSGNQTFMLFGILLCGSISSCASAMIVYISLQDLKLIITSMFWGSHYIQTFAIGLTLKYSSSQTQDLLRFCDNRVGQRSKYLFSINVLLES